MDRSRFRGKVFLDLLSSPWTLIPMAFCWSLGLVAWALEQGPGLVAFLGIGGLLAGLGAMATRWILAGSEISERAFEDLQKEANRRQTAALDELERRLELDDDPRTERALRELRDVYLDFKQDATWPQEMDARTSFEIASKVERLFQECVSSLRSSLELWESAQKMRTEAVRQDVLGSRDELLGEISRNLEQLKKTVDGVRALRLKKGRRADHAQIRRELDASLEEARRIEERLRSLEHDLGGTLTGSERE